MVVFVERKFGQKIYCSFANYNSRKTNNLLIFAKIISVDSFLIHFINIHFKNKFLKSINF